MKDSGKKTKLIEMANIVKYGQFKIDVQTDHEPKHFHLKKTDCYDARINLKTSKLIDYKWQKNSKCVMTSSDEKKMMEMLETKFEGNLTFREYMIHVWNSLNGNNRYLTLTKYKKKFKN